MVKVMIGTIWRESNYRSCSKVIVFELFCSQPAFIPWRTLSGLMLGWKRTNSVCVGWDIPDPWLILRLFRQSLSSFSGSFHVLSFSWDPNSENFYISSLILYWSHALQVPHPCDRIFCNSHYCSFCYLHMGSGEARKCRSSYQSLRVHLRCRETRGLSAWMGNDADDHKWDRWMGRWRRSHV